jgi:hypothetical protein
MDAGTFFGTRGRGCGPMERACVEGFRRHILIASGMVGAG